MYSTLSLSLNLQCLIAQGESGVRLIYISTTCSMRWLHLQAARVNCEVRFSGISIDDAARSAYYSYPDGLCVNHAIYGASDKEMCEGGVNISMRQAFNVGK